MEQQLKQRLVGAVVLVSLAVIFIPVILEGPGDEWPPRNHNIPQPPALDFRTGMELPLPEATDAPAAGPASASPAVAPVPPAAEPEPALTPVPEALAQAEPAPPATPAPPPAAPAGKAAAAPADGWYAQVGSFSQQANAEGLRARLVKAGYAAHLQQTATGKGSSYRVLVGPERTREAAEKLLQTLGRKQQLKGIVIELSAAAG